MGSNMPLPDQSLSRCMVMASSKTPARMEHPAPVIQQSLEQMETVVTELTVQLSQLSAQLKLITAQTPPAMQKASPWLPLREAAPLLHFASARALKNRILKGTFPPDCFRVLPSVSGQRHSYLVNVERYLKSLR